MTTIRNLVLAAVVCAALPAWGAERGAPVVDNALRIALKQAVEDTHSFQDRFAAQVWLADMSRRLEHVVRDPFYRLELLKTVHTEATRAGLQPELVLSVIHVESTFNRYAISATGARGLMQVMPFWVKEIGHPRDNLFEPQTNLRYGCAILKYYLDREKGNVANALARYNGSGGNTVFPHKVFTALRTRWFPQ